MQKFKIYLPSFLRYCSFFNPSYCKVQILQSFTKKCNSIEFNNLHKLINSQKTPLITSFLYIGVYICINKNTISSIHQMPLAKELLKKLPDA